MMIHRFTVAAVCLFASAATDGIAAAESTIPEHIYDGVEYALSLSESSEILAPENFTPLIEFILQSQEDTHAVLEENDGAAGAYYRFSLQAPPGRIIGYTYNPDIPSYITSPSSLQSHIWLTPETTDGLRELPAIIEKAEETFLLHGTELEVITPDTNTGGYYTYSQHRVLAVVPGPTGPVIVSASRQPEQSEVGRKGCVVGDDKNWNYLFSGEKGLNKMGLGWVDSYMYQARSVIVYIPDPSGASVRVGLFKWLNAGWKTINMVKSSHILEGIKRFAADFKAILEAPALPAPQILADMYRQLQQSDDRQLRDQVLPYLAGLGGMDPSELCSNLFRKQLSSGEYLEQMDRDEMIRILMLEFLKDSLGKEVVAAVQPRARAAGPPSLN